MKKCDRCGRKVKRRRRFCAGQYHFCATCAKDWYKIFERNGSWSQPLFEAWRTQQIKGEPFVFR